MQTGKGVEAMNARRLISRQVRQMEVESFDPGPIPDDGILVRNDYNAVSVGTEIWNWIHGAEPSREPVFPRTTGYCNCGTVLAVGSQASDRRITYPPGIFLPHSRSRKAINNPSPHHPITHRRHR